MDSVDIWFKCVGKDFFSMCRRTRVSPFPLTCKRPSKANEHCDEKRMISERHAREARVFARSRKTSH